MTKAAAALASIPYWCGKQKSAQLPKIINQPLERRSTHIEMWRKDQYSSLTDIIPRMTIGHNFRRRDIAHGSPIERITEHDHCGYSVWVEAYLPRKLRT